MRHYPDSFVIEVEYNDVKYTVDDEDTYNKYKDCIGADVSAVLYTELYDDGTRWETIESLE